MFNDLLAGMPQIGTVLVLEDEMLVAVLVEDCLRELGATDVVICMNLPEAERVLAGQQIDCAVLDVKVGGSASFSIADWLVERGIPFIFASASMPEEFPERHAGRIRLSKPFSNEQLIKAVLAANAGMREEA